MPLCSPNQRPEDIATSRNTLGLSDAPFKQLFLKIDVET